jgi:hypothetical protein
MISLGIVSRSRSGRSRCRFVVLLAAPGWLWQPAPSTAAEQFQADTWRAECEGAAPGTGCSIIGTFRSMRNDGSFALALDMQSGVLAIVGEPPPLGATLQIDRFPKIHCSGPRYCLFALQDSAAAAGQLAAGSIVLIDVETQNGILRSSLSTRGYRAALAKLRSWQNPFGGLQPGKFEPVNPAAGRKPASPASGSVR